MTSIEFVLWLNGAADLVGDQPPTPEQWATVREKLGETVGGLVAARLLERVDNPLFTGGALYWGSQYNAPPASTIIGVPETPKPHNPGLLNRILGKTTT